MLDICLIVAKTHWNSIQLDRESLFTSSHSILTLMRDMGDVFQKLENISKFFCCLGSIKNFLSWAI